MRVADTDPVVAAVQTNCHIADERHAGDMTLCIYLLQMREFYRWERGLAFGAPLPRDAVGAWIAEREGLWATLAGQDFVPLPCGPGDRVLDPFDVDAVNAWLHPRGATRLGFDIAATGQYWIDRHGTGQDRAMPAGAAGA